MVPPVPNVPSGSPALVNRVTDTSLPDWVATVTVPPASACTRRAWKAASFVARMTLPPPNVESTVPLASRRRSRVVVVFCTSSKASLMT